MRPGAVRGCARHCLLAATAWPPAHCGDLQSQRLQRQPEDPDCSRNSTRPTASARPWSAWGLRRQPDRSRRWPMASSSTGPRSPPPRCDRDDPSTLVNANTATPDFLTPNVTTSTTLPFRLPPPALDGEQYRHRHGARASINQPPACGPRLGHAARLAYPGDTITLEQPRSPPVTRAASSDPDGDALIYQWTRTAGPAMTLVNANTATATFVAPPTPGADYSLTSAGCACPIPAGLSSTTSVVVNVTAEVPPLARPGLSRNRQRRRARRARRQHVDAGHTAKHWLHQWTQPQGSPAIVVGDATGSSRNSCARTDRQLRRLPRFRVAGRQRRSARTLPTVRCRSSTSPIP